MLLLFLTGNTLPIDGSQIAMKSLPFSFCACINNTVFLLIAFQSQLGRCNISSCC